MTKLERISTPAAPKPAGHYSQAVRYGDLVFLSGLLAASLEGKPLAEKSFEEQVHVALANMVAILKAAGSGTERVLKVTAFIVGVENWPVFNAIYAQVFGEAKPARSVVPVTTLRHGCLVEIECIAAAGS